MRRDQFPPVVAVTTPLIATGTADAADVALSAGGSRLAVDHVERFFTRPAAVTITTDPLGKGLLFSRPGRLATTTGQFSQLFVLLDTIPLPA